MAVYLIDLIIRLKTLSWTILLATLLIDIIVFLACCCEHLEGMPFSKGEKKFYRISIIVIVIQIIFLVFVPSNEILNNLIK